MKYANRMEALRPSDIREAMKMIAANPGTISFAGGLPDSNLFPAEAMRVATDKVLKESSEIALQYGLTLGRVSLRGKIVGLMAREGVEATVDNIAVTTGSQQAITVAAMMLLDEEDVIITENPSYLGALAAFKPFATSYKGVNGDEDGMFMDELEEVIKNTPNAKMIYVIPNFQNPTGRTWSLERRKKLVEIANKYDLPILEDNAYGEVRFDGERIPSIKSFDTEGRVIHLGSFSKILSPGLRVGWACADKEVVSKFELVKNGLDLQSAELAQMQVTEFLENNDLDAHLAMINEVYKERRDLMVKMIEEEFPKEAKYYYPKGGMFVWVELPSHINTRELLKKAIERKVAFVPGGSFYPGNDCESSMRLNFSTMTNEKIVEGIKILGQLLKDYLALNNPDPVPVAIND
ncbi:aminotransferase-like domain-containing protein [Bacillus sp. FJAT-27245]|uniref:aminotransferase-like domain-containing protein n=1 Tax=Bacillus sp. FJAT-27245 TaxID=1684144 RepID=UPI0006A7B533|nr:PLP-dependent aminotransferase family protein [Bacillus sp. FJAT-27245]